MAILQTGKWASEGLTPGEPLSGYYAELSRREIMTDEKKSYDGSCFCGAVRFTVSGEPEAMGYCHCESCRHWSAGPVNAFTLWKPGAMQITRGAQNIGTYNKTSHSYRKWCKTCGGHVFTEHPSWGLMDVYAAAIPDFPYRPGIHVHYQETVLPIKDGLPKMKDLPKEMGGSGITLEE
jgi:hypothetical protein